MHPLFHDPTAEGDLKTTLETASQRLIQFLAYFGAREDLRLYFLQEAFSRETRELVSPKSYLNFMSVIRYVI